MAETSALFSLFAWLLEGFVLTARKKKMLCQLSLQTKRAIYLTKTQFQLHNILRYSVLLRVFFQAGANWRLKYFSESLDGKCRRQIVSIKFFLHSETKNAKFFRMIFCKKIFLLLNDRKSQIPCVKALKYRVFEMEFSSKTVFVWILHKTFSSYMPSVRSLPEATQSTWLVSAMRPRKSKPLKTWRP